MPLFLDTASWMVWMSHTLFNDLLSVHLGCLWSLRVTRTVTVKGGGGGAGERWCSGEEFSLCTHDLTRSCSRWPRLSSQHHLRGWASSRTWASSSEGSDTLLWALWVHLHTRVCIRSYTNVEITSLNFLVVYCHFTLNAPDLTWNFPYVCFYALCLCM